MAAVLTCDQCEALLPGYVLSALEAVEAATVAEHLHACNRCQASLTAYEAVVDHLAHAVPPHEPPAAMLQRLLVAVTDTPPPAVSAPASAPSLWPRTWRFCWACVWHWPRVAAALSLVVVVLWGLTSVLTRSTAVERLTDAAISAHLRSLLVRHLTDIASADPQSVAAWLQERLPFLPPIRELRAQGYTLEGGRLDYLYKHLVAALVYHQGDHLITVFTWPASWGETFPGQLLQDEGFHVMFWTRSGMHYCAISDLGRRDFMAFVHSYGS